ncbi:hypothetical protein A6R68_16568 [Neotoma lepida]|uniref:Uncharacterized protein n=1 Tax=Neotoma lepida TaxID=56216 RepID=A0A1A6HFC7_NEOLE|nr:hypothetical protein A6R68_16568 [Neotoma lepida]
MSELDSEVIGLVGTGETGSLPYEYKIVIAGNHELTFDQEFMADLIKQDFYYFPSVSKLKPENYENVQSLLTNCIYLQDSEVTNSPGWVVLKVTMGPDYLCDGQCVHDNGIIDYNGAAADNSGDSEGAQQLPSEVKPGRGSPGSMAGDSTSHEAKRYWRSGILSRKVLTSS